VTRPPFAPPTEADIAAVSEQLGRPARDVVGIAARCVCGAPTVVSTRPRLADGTPFPTFYYLTHPAATAAVSTLEAEGEMPRLAALLGVPLGVPLEGAAPMGEPSELLERAESAPPTQLAANPERAANAQSAPPTVAAQYHAAHGSYIADRDTFGSVPEIAGISAGGMPDRVKCLHSLVGHALAAGAGVNPIGDLALERSSWDPSVCECAKVLSW